MARAELAGEAERGAQARPAIHQLLTDRRDELLADFERRVREAGLLPEGTQHAQIMDDLPQFLDQVVRALREAIEGVSVPHHEEEPARAHGAQRYALSMNLPTVVREYAVLRRCILDLVGRAGVSATLVEVEKLMSCFDVGVTEAIDEYGERREQEIARHREELEHALQASRLAVRARENVLAVVAHDLKNPLSAMRIAAGRLQRGVDEAASKGMGAVVNRAVTRMDRLITDLLELARWEAGHMALDLQPTEVRPLVREVLEAQLPLAREKGVWLEKERLDASPFILCDRERLQQVLTNLVGNAIKFTSEGGSIFVRLSVEADRVVFEVADTGRGISAHVLPHIFDRFWRPEKGDSGGLGHGLGLAIARGIVQAHGGEIWVTSTEGAGSSFFFSLPLHVPPSDKWALG